MVAHWILRLTSFLFAGAAVVGARAQSADTVPGAQLPSVHVLSPRVANQEPPATLAMPISGLRFEPQVDVQSRNLAEGQADVSIRGGTFANTGFQLGALPLWDPQTGHYSAELPIAPELLAPPRVLTGAGHAAQAWNASVGSVHYGWRPVAAGGHVAVGVGDYSTYRGEARVGARTTGGWGADVAMAYSESEGSVPFGDHEFARYNLRVQHQGEGSQTDLFAGYQSKFFGWPNLYTPFNSPESENLQTVLVAGTHRRTWGAEGDAVEIGLYHRRNKDDYRFNRFAPVGPVHPFQHTTWVTGAGATGRWTLNEHWALQARGTALADRIESTSLLYGRFSTRSYWSFGVYPEWRSELGGGRTQTVTAGFTYDDTNRDQSQISPLMEWAVSDPAALIGRWALSYAQSSQVADYTALNSNPAAGLFRGNRGLGRATTHNLELDGTFSWRDWQGRAALFLRRDDDLVDWTFRQGVTARLASAVDIDTYGAEFFARRSWERFDLMLGYTWLEKREDYGGVTVDGSFYALNYPEHRLTAAVVVRLGRGWELRVDNEARLQAGNPLRQKGGDEALLTAIGLYWRVPQVPGLQLSAQVDNLWDERFEEVPAVPAARRLAMVGARWMW